VDITEMIVDQAIRDLQVACIDDLYIDDLSRAGVVKRGPLQADPVSERIVILVYTTDPDAADRIEKQHHMDEMPGKSGYFRELDGGYGMIRKLYITVELFLLNTQESHDDAARLAGRVVKRIENVLVQGNVLGQTDEFGETVYDVQIMISNIVPGGGDKQWIYRGKLELDYRTFQEG
jgi:hypothetical protein